MKFTQELKEAVRMCLIAAPMYRDNDRKLLARIWALYLEAKGKSLKEISAYELMVMFVQEEVPHFESIRRTRQKIQETIPELRGKKYKERHQKSEVVKEGLREWEL